jgi:four helix bundle protein
MKRVQSYRDLDVYKIAMDASMKIFELAKAFPSEERYSLTDQIRRSSRSVCANIAEAWRKRRYKLAFVSKLNDAETEAAETQVWLEYCWRCRYIEKQKYAEYCEHYNHIIGKLVRMIDNPDPWLISSVSLQEKKRRSRD